MVWRLSVFFLCSYRQFRRCWRLFRSPGAGRWWSVSGGGLGLLAVGSGNGMGSGKRDGASQDGGRVLPHILPTPPRTCGCRKTGRVSFCNPGLKSSEPHAGLSKISSFYWTCFERKLCYFEDRQDYMITIMVRGCSRCLVARRKRAAGRAAETREARFSAGSHPAPPANFERGGGVDAEGTEEYLEAQVRHRRSA